MPGFAGIIQAPRRADPLRGTKQQILAIEGCAGSSYCIFELKKTQHSWIKLLYFYTIEDPADLDQVIIFLHY
jgi:hypothetical protein